MNDPQDLPRTALPASLHEAIVESSDDAIVSETLDGLVTSWNRAAEHLFGWRAAEMIGRPFAAVVPPDRLDEEPPIRARIARGERVQRLQTLRLRRDGSTVHVSTTLSPMHDGQGRVVGVSKSLRDISERVERDELAAELALDAQRFAALVASSDDAIISKSLQGIVTSWNRGAERIFGYTAWEIVGRPMLLLFPPDRLDEEPAILARVARGETVEHFETVRLHKSGREVAVSVTISPIHDARGEVIGASKIARDISDRVEREARAAALALESQRLAAIVESSDDAIIGKTLDGVVTSWNRGAEAIFGWRADEIIGCPLAVLVPPDRQGEEAQILARLARGEKVDHFETVRMRKDGALVNVSATVSPVFDRQGVVIGAAKIARDITDRIQAERTIWLQANFDALTHLPNRRNFQDRLRQELVRARRSRKHVAVMFIDLDRFKEVNDTLGHQAGDELLLQAASRIKASLREVDTVARMGGDEFTVLLPEIGRAEEAAPIAQRLNQCLFEPFVLGEVPVHISGSIGVALFPDDGQSVDDLLKNADQAMYESKRNGRNQTRYFVRQVQAGARDRLKLAADLRHAIERQELRLVYQPVVNLVDGSVRKFEALIRWQHPTLGLISPAQFVPIAEETGLIGDIGDWVFRTAARQAHDWRQRFGDGVQVALNLSPAQLHGSMGYFERWIHALAELGLPGAALVVEVTEGMMVDRGDEVAAKLRVLRQAGIQVAIDDFGTGYSSLSYLSRLDINFLKIDQAFTRAIGAAHRDIALCEAIVVMAHKLGLRVVAEGIETQEQERLLRQIGCDFGQGYRFSAPLPVADAEAFFTARAGHAPAGGAPLLSLVSSK